MRYYNHDYARLQRVKEWSDHFSAWEKRTRHRRPSVAWAYPNLRETALDYNSRKGRLRMRILRELVNMKVYNW